ncbi:FAD-dependent oxidoreductase [Candidatus Peribacteria bacterium]|nr:FAD-dependent oxidoreductase [Candidatus Peribacteria bacterium]
MQQNHHNQRDWSAQRVAGGTKPPIPPLLDVIIIGAGPAGITATVYAARRGLQTLLITGDIGGQMRMSADIQNWTGTTHSTGPVLSQLFYDHVQLLWKQQDTFDLWLAEGDRVTPGGVQQVDGHFSLTTEGGQQYRSRTLILAVGKHPRSLGIPGEEAARRTKTLSFSGTMDAALYRGKHVVVIGGGNSALETALQLEKFTGTITLCTDIDRLIGDQVLIDQILERTQTFTVRYKTHTEAILLDEHDRVRGIALREDGGPRQELGCEGVFEQIGQSPSTGFLQSFVALDDHGQIITDRDTHTSVEGCFAAGDCTIQKHKQVIVAAGQGAMAALESYYYLQNTTSL